MLSQQTIRDAPTKLAMYKQGLQKELDELLSWWMHYMIDEQHGGFYAAVNNDNKPVPGLKGIVLNSRILWTFSAAYLHSSQQQYLQTATRAFHYIEQYFIDKNYGGVFWSVDETGQMKDGKKQVYGLAFCLYGLCEYYKASGDNAALVRAKEMYSTIEQYSFDKKHGGYIEAFTRDWAAADDLRLSDKDDNERKTMNTHLHIVEAYTNLYSVWPDAGLQQQIEALLGYFDRYIINKESRHLNLFMNDEWVVQSSLVSYGHDIEAAWLLFDSAEAISNALFIQLYKNWSISLATSAAKGLDTDGGLWYEYDLSNNHLIKEKHWWPQAEAMIGFFNAYQVSGDEQYLDYSLGCFAFVQKHIRDKQNGEWYWGITEDGQIINKEKAGFWKCPYHNGRACIELIKRISSKKFSV